MNTCKFITFVVLTILAGISLVFAFGHPSVNTQFMIIKYHFCIYLGPNKMPAIIDNINMQCFVIQPMIELLMKLVRNNAIFI